MMLQIVGWIIAIPMFIVSIIHIITSIGIMIDEDIMLGVISMCLVPIGFIISGVFVCVGLGLVT